MIRKREKQISLFQHWTRTYFLNLLFGAIVIACITVILLSYMTKEMRLEKMKTLAHELTIQSMDENTGEFLDDRTIDQNFKRIHRILQINSPVHLVVVDKEMKLIFPREPSAPPSTEERITVPGVGGENRPLGHKMMRVIHQMPIGKELTFFEQTIDGFGKSYFVKAPIYHNGQMVGEVILGMTKKDATRLTINYPLFTSILLGVLLLGWGTIFMLTKRLLRPIEEVAVAANAMKDGQYDIEINKEIKEKEVYEMMTAIQTMAEKLKHLESLRTILLAGVTHELKTPIASISGLVQAVKDNVVSGEEKDEFLFLTLQEADRLKKMVEDLLDFNGFATGALKAEMEQIDLRKFVKEVVHQWQMANEKHKGLNLVIEHDSCPSYVLGDPVRIQQIIVNLLNNAFHAMRETGTIQIRLYTYENGYAGMDIKDNGQGIPDEERSYIFELYYRGNKKKYKVKGLGIGLPFSLMLAKAQGGDLYLKETSSMGTVFTLTLPIKNIVK